jgi:hypothetical protein
VLFSTLFSPRRIVSDLTSIFFFSLIGIGKEKEVLAMENGGNAKVNAIFEARLTNPSAKPGQHADGPTRERFIRDKYERRKFYDPQGFADYAAHVDMHPGAPDTSRPTMASRGPPSDAAKQRLEERRTRISKASSSVEDSSRNNIKKSTARQKMQIAQAPVSAPLAANVDLLDLMDTPQTTSEQQTSLKQESSAAMDLFGDFVTAGNDAEKKPTETANNKPQTNFGDDILSLYGNNHNHIPQQISNGYGNNVMYQSNNNMNTTTNNPNMMMMMMNNANNNNNMMQMQNMMQNMTFQQQSMLTPQQQQQQMMMMMQQQQFGANNPMMMNYNSNNNNTNGYNPNMMHGVGMPGYNQNNNNMMTTTMMMNPVAGGSGMNNVAGSSNQQLPPIRQIQFAKTPSPAATASKQKPEKEDPFAQFGMNVFRS